MSKQLMEERLRVSKIEVNKKPPRRIFHSIKGYEGDYQADIMFMRYAQSAKYIKINEGYTCALLAVEVPTRFAYIVPMTDKTSLSVNEAFKRIYRDVISNGKLFLRVTTDNGQEFNNKSWDSMMEELRISQYVKEPDDRYTMGVIDRLCSTLKDWINSWQITNDNLSWVQALPEIIEKYNTHQIQTLEASPEDLRNYDSPEGSMSDYASAQASTSKRGEPAINKFHGFNITDHVRVRLRPFEQPGELGKKAAFAKKGREHWSKKVYVIQGIRANSFILSDLSGNPVARTYRHHDLMRVPPTSVDIPELFEDVSKQARASRRNKKDLR